MLRGSAACASLTLLHLQANAQAQSLHLQRVCLERVCLCICLRVGLECVLRASSCQVLLSNRSLACCRQV